MVNRNIKEALDLCCVQVHGQNAVCAGCGNQVCHQLCRDRISGFCFSVLSCITKIWDNCCNTTGRSAFKRIDHNQQFHQVIVDRCAGGLYHKHVRTTDRLLNGNTDLAVGEGFYLTFSQWKAQTSRDLCSHLWVGIGSEDFDVLTMQIHFFSDSPYFSWQISPPTFCLLFSRSKEYPANSRSTAGPLCKVSHCVIQNYFPLLCCFFSSSRWR